LLIGSDRPGHYLLVNISSPKAAIKFLFLIRC
jgi:hypothetical protein